MIGTDQYISLRAWLLTNDPDAGEMVEWAESLRPPDDPVSLAEEVVWIILCAGRTAQSARTISRLVWAAIHNGRPVIEAFGHRARAAAIERAWREREQDFQAMQRALAAGPDAVLTGA